MIDFPEGFFLQLFHSCDNCVVQGVCPSTDRSHGYERTRCFQDFFGNFERITTSRLFHSLQCKNIYLKKGITSS